MGRTTYVGRFAPSPTGALHAGSVATALASWLDARAHGSAARWLVRIEDVDRPRCVAGATEAILDQLQALQLLPDELPIHQSARTARYEQALQTLSQAGRAYPCNCSRQDVLQALARAGRPHQRHAEIVYPGTCRIGVAARARSAWRFRIQPQAGSATAAVSPVLDWIDRRLGRQSQDVSTAIGDFVLKRADGLFSYQLAVVVDDADQGVTDIVRGEDLCDNTARQILLQQALGLPRPTYLHTPLVRAPNGEKLSKQSGAEPVDTTEPLAVLNAAAAVLGLQRHAGPLPDALAAWVRAWACLYNPGPP